MRDKLLQNLAFASAESAVVKRVDLDVADPQLMKVHT